MATRVVQISDLHLLTNPLAELQGIGTRQRLEVVLDVLRHECASAERLIVTGDLAHDERLETYQALRELLADWLPLLRIVPGNHDNRSAMRAVFGERVQVVAERIVFVDSLDGWKLIGLDSHLPGEVRGQLGQQQLDWLQRELASEPDQTIAVFVHHPPVPVASKWLDEIGLNDAGPLLELLRSFPQVKVVCCGHVHQELAVHDGGVLAFATPSTSVQFRPNTATLVVDAVSPGFRILDFEADGSFRTRIVRVPIS